MNIFVHLMLFNENTVIYLIGIIIIVIFISLIIPTINLSYKKPITLIKQLAFLCYKIIIN